MVITYADLASCVLQSAPDSPEAWLRLGSCRFQLEQHSLAVPPLRRAVRLLTSTLTSPAAPSSPELQDGLWLLIQVRALMQTVQALAQHVDQRGTI